MALQLLVENAVKHCMNPYAGTLNVLIRTIKTTSGVEITVTDNGPGFDPDDNSKPHTTLENIRKRPEMMCKGKLTITLRDGGGTSVKITIPLSDKYKTAVFPVITENDRFFAKTKRP